MNKRKMKKKLKKQIGKLQSDNDLMHKIIADSPSMQELYDRYNQPLRNVVYTSMRFQKFEAKSIVNDDYGMEYSKLSAARDLLNKIKDEITYRVDTEYGFTTVTASIIVAYNDQKEEK